MTDLQQQPPAAKPAPVVKSEGRMVPVGLMVAERQQKQEAQAAVEQMQKLVEQALEICKQQAEQIKEHEKTIASLRAQADTRVMGDHKSSRLYALLGQGPLPGKVS